MRANLEPEPLSGLDDKLARRLDELSRTAKIVQRDTAVVSETLALFVRYFLTITPPLPKSEQEPARLLGRERFEMFVAQIGRRLASDQRLVSEVLESIAENNPDLFATAEMAETKAPVHPGAQMVRPSQSRMPPKPAPRPGRTKSMADLFSLAATQEAQGRRRQMLRTAFGPTIAAALADPTVLEVMLNPDGKLWIDRATDGRTRLRRAHRQHRSRAHHPPRRQPRPPRGQRQGADRLRRAARDGRALRGRLAAGLACALLLDPQAGRRRVPPRRLRRPPAS